MTPTVVDVLFPVRGGPVPLDHGYLLFSALSRRLPELHERHDLGVFNLRGTQVEDSALQLERGTLRLRCPAEAVSALLPLAGGALRLAGQELRLGNPELRPLREAPGLSARLVTFKHALDAASFESATRRFLGERGCEGRVALGRRRIVSIAGSKVVGFALTVEGLTPESSLRLQVQGLGGRRHLGCGLFLPLRSDRGRNIPSPSGLYPSRGMDRHLESAHPLGLSPTDRSR